MQATFVKFDRVFLDLSGTWLNDPEIRYLTNSGEVSKEQQEAWFISLPERKDYCIWGIKADSVPVGVCGLKNITASDCEYWGYIGEKQYWGKGLGKELMIYLEGQALGMGKSSIWLRVIRENARAISLYTKQGYIIESEIDSLIVMRKKL